MCVNIISMSSSLNKKAGTFVDIVLFLETWWISRLCSLDRVYCEVFSSSL